MNMKTKHIVIITLNLILAFVLIFLERLQITDILLIYPLVLIPSFVLVNIEFLFRRKQTYSKFLLDKLFFNLGFIIVLYSAVFFFTQPKYIAKDKAIDDLNFMIKTLENVHPDIYHSIRKDSFLIIFNQEVDALPKKVSELEFFKICARLNAHFKTGHTRPMENLLTSNHLFKNVFPYELKIIDERLFITNDLSIFKSVPIGSEVIELNGKKVAQLIDEWSELASYESIVNRNNRIANPGHIGMWNNYKSYTLKYKDYNNQKIKEKIINGGIVTTIASSIKLHGKKRNNFVYKELSPEIGYIGFFSCMDLESYKDFFLSSFKKLKSKEIKHLIIDIRDNGGGYSVIADDLMQYIFHQPHNELDSGIVKVSDELIATGKVKDKLWFVEKPEVGKTYTRKPGLRELKNYPDRFNGNTYLLTNSGTFSAGQGFASAYRCYGNGIIIGEETGGATVNFGDVHIFELPNSGLKMMTSWEQAFSACGKDNHRGVIPDFIVENSISDYINGTDRILDFTLDLINN